MIRTASRGYSPLLAHPFAEGGVNMDEIFKRGTCRHFKELTPVAKEDLLTLRHLGSYLQGHPDMKHIPHKR